MEDNIAEKIFKEYRGKYFYLMREGNGDYELYRSFGISKEQEKTWLIEMQADFFESYTHAQCGAQLLDALAKYVDVTKELHDQQAIWELCTYIRENILNWNVSTILDCTWILFRARTILDPSYDVQQRFCFNIIEILSEAEKNTNDSVEKAQCEKYILAVKEAGVKTRKTRGQFLP